LGPASFLRTRCSPCRVRLDAPQARAIASRDNAIDRSPARRVDTNGPKFDLGDATGGADTGAQEMCPCAPKLDLIYLLSDDRELWTYAPLSNTFTMIGPLGCPTTDGTFSMGVGRDGKAWIQTTYLDDAINQTYIGDLFILDVNDPVNCTDPGYTPGAGGWQHFGMGFVSNSASDPCDMLYAQHWNGVAGGFTEGPNDGLLGVFDPVALQVKTIGPTNYNGAELTGTGDGRLFAFAGAPSSKLIEFDKATAQVLATTPFNNFPLTSAFAFAFSQLDADAARMVAAPVCSPAFKISFPAWWPPFGATMPSLLWPPRSCRQNLGPSQRSSAHWATRSARASPTSTRRAAA